MANIIKRDGPASSLAQRLKSNDLQNQSPRPLPIPNASKARSNVLQIAFAFDTTGSMYPYYQAGIDAIGRIATEVKAKNPDSEFCYIPYKNHGDEEDFFNGVQPFFATDFMSSPEAMQEALQKIRNGGGGDGLTGLEDVLHFLAQEVHWKPGATKVNVLIGDMPPHGVIDAISVCPHEYDYQDEAEKLKVKGVKVYSVFCFDEKELISRRLQKVQEFFKWIAENNGGKYLEMADIGEIADLLIGICMKETGHLKDFIRDLKGRGQLSPATERKLLLLEGKSHG